MKQFEEVKSLVAELEAEVSSFYEKSNKAAARRSRKLYQAIGKLCKEARKQISEDLKGLPAKAPKAAKAKVTA